MESDLRVRRLQKCVECVPDVLQGAPIQAVARPWAIGRDVHDADILKHLQVPRDRGLGERKRRDDVPADALVMRGQMPDDGQARGMRQRLGAIGQAAKILGKRWGSHGLDLSGSKISVKARSFRPSPSADPVHETPCRTFYSRSRAAFRSPITAGSTREWSARVRGRGSDHEYVARRDGTKGWHEKALRCGGDLFRPAEGFRHVHDASRDRKRSKWDLRVASGHDHLTLGEWRDGVEHDPTDVESG